MTAEHNSVVIVGAGQAGAWVAITLRELDPTRSITLIGAEPHPPYERPPLSKAILSGTATLESAYIKPSAFYDDQAITMLLDSAVSRIDHENKTVVLADNRLVPYGVLVLATGARPRPLPLPGAELPQVHMLRSAADAARIKPQLRPGQRVVAIGAGFIGLELAAAAVGAGCIVTVLDAAPQPMGRVVDKAVAEVIATSHRSRGVSLRLSCKIAGIVADGEQVAVELGDGEKIPADLVIVGVGSIPNTELAQQAGIDCEDGVLVDAMGRTSVADIYAVGDVSRHFNPLLGRSLRLESWQNAQNHGQAVARIVAGGEQPYAEVPWFWTDQYDFNFQMAGAPTSWDRVVWRGQPDSGKFTAFYLQGDRVVAGNTFNNARDMRFIKQLISGAMPVQDAMLADPAQSLAKLIQGQ